MPTRNERAWRAYLRKTTGTSHNGNPISTDYSSRRLLIRFGDQRLHLNIFIRVTAYECAADYGPYETYRAQAIATVDDIRDIASCRFVPSSDNRTFEDYHQAAMYFMHMRPFELANSFTYLQDD